MKRDVNNPEQNRKEIDVTADVIDKEDIAGKMDSFLKSISIQVINFRSLLRKK